MVSTASPWAIRGGMKATTGTKPAGQEAPIDLRLRSLHYFLTLAEERHFGRAAHRLGIAQPGLSQQIQKLEELVGHRLLSRRPRVRLTPAGEALQRSARSTLESATTALSAARRAGRGETGTLVVGFAASVLLTPVAKAISRFRDTYPDVHLDLRELSTAHQIEALEASSIDIGFLREPSESLGNWVVREIWHEPLMVALPPGHPLSDASGISLRALADDPFVFFPAWASPGLHRRILTLCEDGGLVPRVVQEAREWTTILALVNAGHGVSIVPESFRQMGWGGVKLLPVRSVKSGTAISIGLAGDSTPVLVAEFTEVVDQVVAEAASAR
jgi:DNA-binding transcriptional LysR family regulator